MAEHVGLAGVVLRPVAAMTVLSGVLVFLSGIIGFSTYLVTATGARKWPKWLQILLVVGLTVLGPWHQRLSYPLSPYWSSASLAGASTMFKSADAARAARLNSGVSPLGENVSAINASLIIGLPRRFATHGFRKCSMGGNPLLLFVIFALLMSVALLAVAVPDSTRDLAGLLAISLGTAFLIAFPGMLFSRLPNSVLVASDRIAIGRTVIPMSDIQSAVVGTTTSR